jgi:hypothetical protein
MAVAVVMDFAGATTDQYDQVTEKMGFTPGGPGAPDCLFHWCAATAEGIRVIDVWPKKEQWEAFAAEKIGPISQEVGIAGPPDVKFVDVHNYFTGA